MTIKWLENKDISLSRKILAGSQLKPAGKEQMPFSHERNWKTTSAKAPGNNSKPIPKMSSILSRAVLEDKLTGRNIEPVSDPA